MMWKNDLRAIYVYYLMSGTLITSVYVAHCGLLVQAIHIQKLLVCWPGLHFLHILSMLLKFSLKEKIVLSPSEQSIKFPDNPYRHVPYNK